MGINQDDFEKLNMRGIIISSIMTAFGLVVALAWKDTINATVAYLMPDNDDGTLKGMYITAVAVTAMELYPFKARSQFEYVLQWLKNWA